MLKGLLLQSAGSVRTESSIDFQLVEIIPGRINISDAVYQSTFNGDTYLIPVGDNSKVKIKAGERTCFYCFLKSRNLTNGNVAPISDDVTLPLSNVSPGVESIFDIPSDCSYITILKRANANYYIPEYLVLNS